jgi:peptide/nickel transport system permease protein
MPAVGAAPPTPVAPAAPRKRKFKRPTIGVIFGVVWLSTLTFMSALAEHLPFIRDYGTTVKVIGSTKRRYKLGPGWDAWFGLDASNKDLFAKCIYGARTTLVIGVGATIIGLVIGGFLGVVAGYFRKWVDRAVMIFTDCLLALPALLLAMILVFRLDDIKEQYTWLGWMTRKWQITLTLGTLAIAPLARIVRAQTLSLREREFVLAARSLGAKNGRIIVREILPNLIPSMMTVAMTGLGILIAAEGALAFLGLSVEIPTPTWGRLIDDNRNRMDEAWWGAIFPCVMLFLTVLSFNLIGDRLARRFDIREAGV